MPRREIESTEWADTAGAVAAAVLPCWIADTIGVRGMADAAGYAAGRLVANVNHAAAEGIEYP
jgi:hypothetical protein